MVQAEEDGHTRGRLKVFLGYASGVGKSFRMFDEGRRRKERGEDVVIGAMQSRASDEVADVVRNLEVVPLQYVDDRPSMDVPALRKRHPRVCLVDGLAYDNPPGSPNASRWEDVRDLLAAQISVITTINIQYIAELRDGVERLTGKHVAQTIPRSFLYNADEIVVVDAPPDPTPLSLETTAEEDSRRVSMLSELREIALLLAADVVDHQLEEYLQQHQGAQLYGTQERILVCVTPRSSAREMIHRARRQADRFHGDLYVVYVEQDGLNEADQRLIRENLDYAHEAKARVELLNGDDPTEAILDFAAKHGVTQIFVGHSNQTGWTSRLRANPVERLIREADGIDVRVFPNETVNA
jgi:two-component system, OmpR family, sensor histidine kinase KdpD